MTSILERLAVGNLEDLGNPVEEIGSILNVAEEVEVNLSRVKYNKIPLKDREPIPVEKMRETISWIREQIASEKILVACHYGMGRSASVGIGYLCNLGFGYKEALDFVCLKRPGINPLPGLGETIGQILSDHGARKCILQ